MTTQLEAKKICENVLGQEVIPLLYDISGLTSCSTELSPDIVKFDDDGFYLARSGWRIPLKAVDRVGFDVEKNIVYLILKEYCLERRRLCGLPWQP